MRGHQIFTKPLYTVFFYYPKIKIKCIKISSFPITIDVFELCLKLQQQFHLTAEWPTTQPVQTGKWDPICLVTQALLMWSTGDYGHLVSHSVWIHFDWLWWMRLQQWIPKVYRMCCTWQIFCTIFAAKICHLCHKHLPNICQFFDEF